MKFTAFAKRVFAALMVCALLLTVPVTRVSAQNDRPKNRFNVAIVLDASGSMRNTDPNGYRYEAIGQFTGLLAQSGNVLGGVVFHDGVEAELAPTLITNQAGKDAVTDMLESVPSNDGWTNTGAGLSRAVEMLKANGDPNLPSVVVFLSDGNTDMGEEEATQASLDLKADAIQAAREADIAIYSVCLNANNSADVTEMQQIADATGGVFEEVAKAEDLQDVFNTFYNLIYGTSTIKLVDEVFPDSGYLETTFEIPGLGVEEVNIIIYGNTTKKSLVRPDGTESQTTVVEADTFSMLKLTDVVPGTWTLITEGVPGDSIKINMVYNTDLGVDVTVTPGFDVEPTENVTITAKLKGTEAEATASEQYIGYSAKLEILDGYGDPLETVDMNVVGDHFEVQRTFDEGTYYYIVTVTGNHIQKTSEKIGPLVSAPAQAVPVVNQAPVPVSDVVEASVKIWPFKGGSYVLDLKTLATDAEDSVLRYKIESSSFIDGTDYTVDSDDILTLDHFSLSKGAFTVSATDSGGLSCNIEVIVKTINIGLLAFLTMVIGGGIALIVFAIVVYKNAQPWRGTITVRNAANQVANTRGDFRGSVGLKKFCIGPCGIDGKFNATGHNRMEFVSKKPVIAVRNGIASPESKRVSLSDGTVSIYADQGRTNGIIVELKGQPSFGGFGGFGGGGSFGGGKAKAPKGRGKTPAPPPGGNPFM